MSACGSPRPGPLWAPGARRVDLLFDQTVWDGVEGDAGEVAGVVPAVELLVLRLLGDVDSDGFWGPAARQQHVELLALADLVPVVLEGSRGDGRVVELASELPVAERVGLFGDVPLVVRHNDLHVWRVGLGNYIIIILSIK